MNTIAHLKWYDWQKKIIEHKGNVTIRGNRQAGKSKSVAKRIYDLAKLYPGEKTLIIAASERQENYLYEDVRKLIGKDYIGRSTLTRTVLTNGHEIWKFPVGVSGIFLEGLSNIAFLYADEAIHIGRRVWDSIMPMIAEPRSRGLGWITLLSTTRGKPKGFFFDSFQRKDFLQVHIKADDCPHLDKEFLEEERKRLGEIMYNVIWNGEFNEEASKYWPGELIDRGVKIKEFKKAELADGGFYLGIDPARYGKSKAAFVVSQLKKETVRLIGCVILNKSSLIDLGNKTNELNNLFKFEKIFIDDGGFGAGLIDFLGADKKLKKRLRPMNNGSSGKEGKILKEDLYSNFRQLLEREKLEIINEVNLIAGLKGVEYEGPEGEEEIKGTDVSEAATRAAWCSKERNKKRVVVSF